MDAGTYAPPVVATFGQSLRFSGQKRHSEFVFTRLPDCPKSESRPFSHSFTICNNFDGKDQQAVLTRDCLRLAKGNIYFLSHAVDDDLMTFDEKQNRPIGKEIFVLFFFLRCCQSLGFWYEL